MADYTIRLQGQDNLSNTIKNVRQEVGNLGKETTKLDNIQRKFEQISNSQAPLKRQLRELKTIMSQMNLDGLSDTTQFEKIAMRAGEIRDAIGDADNAINRFASDTFRLDAGIQALQGLAAGAAVAQGAFGLLGIENEKTQQAILKVQSAIAVLNGVQTIANMLQRDSALILRLKQISTEVLTAATAKNTIATAANSAITKKDTIITQAWNVAKAVSKAILGDFTGLVLVGGTALASYAAYQALTTDETKKATEAVKKDTEARKTYNATLSQTYADLMTKYTKLKTEWEALSTAHSKVQWIKTNQRELQDLGIKFNTLQDVENAFVRNTQNVVDGFMKRAKAAAAMAQMTENYKKQFELQQKINNANKDASNRVKGNNGKPYKAGDVFKGETYKMGFMPEDFKNGKLTESGARKANATQVFSNSTSTNALRDEMKNLENSNKALAEEIAANARENTRNNISSSTPRTNGGGGGSSSSNPQAVKGSIKDIEGEINNLQNSLNNGLIPKSQIEASISKLWELKNVLYNLKKEMEAIGVGVRFDKVMADKGNEIKDSLNKSIKSSNIGGDFVNEMQKSFDREKDLELRNIPTDKIEKDLESISDASKDSAKKSGKAFKGDLVDSLDAIGGMFSSAGNLARAFGDETTAAAMQCITATASAAATIIPEVMKVIGVKQGEALASGEASAAKLPFPANLAAIATIVATLLSTFATIASVTSGGFASGGVVKGNSYVGDHNLYGLNAGETVLTQSQSASLWAALESGRLGYSRPFSSSDITFKIKGSDLYGALNNYNKIKSKTR